MPEGMPKPKAGYLSRVAGAPAGYPQKT